MAPITTTSGTASGDAIAINETDRLIASDKAEGMAVYNRADGTSDRFQRWPVHFPSQRELVVPPLSLIILEYENL